MRESAVQAALAREAGLSTSVAESSVSPSRNALTQRQPRLAWTVLRDAGSAAAAASKGPLPARNLDSTVIEAHAGSVRPMGGAASNGGLCAFKRGGLQLW